jgi:hypothetical protein
VLLLLPTRQALIAKEEAPQSFMEEGFFRLGHFGGVGGGGGGVLGGGGGGGEGGGGDVLLGVECLKRWCMGAVECGG